MKAHRQGLALQHLSPLCFGMMLALPQSAHLDCGSICPLEKVASSGITRNRPGGSLYIFLLFCSENYRLGWRRDGGWRPRTGVVQGRGMVDGDRGLGGTEACSLERDNLAETSPGTARSPRILGLSGPSLEESLQRDPGDGPGGGHWCGDHTKVAPPEGPPRTTSGAGSHLSMGLGWLSSAWHPQPALCTCCPHTRDSHPSSPLPRPLLK